jgi:quercetin 2,3-dioxygenase
MEPMSGPVTRDDAPLVPETSDDHAAPPAAEEIPSRSVSLGGVPVQRALPRRAHRTIGAWCFLDHFGPTLPGAPMQIGPHPHIGLQTVTWLVEGEVLHRDSLGTRQTIVPGQLNLMTAGHGISHAEETPRGSVSEQLGAQLWVAQPEATRHGDPAFEHHAALPVRIEGGWTSTVLTGALGPDLSPARTDTDLVGVALATVDGGRRRLPLDRRFKQGLVVLRGSMDLDGRSVGPGVLVYLAPGHDSLTLAASHGADVVLVGGVPFPEPVTMFWNFVGRTAGEMRAARTEWAEGSPRFGRVDSDLAPIAAPPVPNIS